MVQSTNDRTATLSDGSVLTYQRPGNAVLDTLEQTSQQRAAERNADRASQNSMTPEQFAAVGRAHMEAATEERRRIRALPNAAERRKARVNALLESLSHRLVVATCAEHWNAHDVKETTEEGLKEVGRDLLEEAAEHILNSHFARREDHLGNSAPTTAP